MYLYKISFPGKTNKQYIGATTNIKNRINSHKYNNKGALFHAIKEFGDPKVDILAEFNNRRDLAIAEKNAIHEFNTIDPNGFNKSKNSIGIKQTDYGENPGGLNERKSAQRKREREDGFVRMDIKVRPEHKQAVTEFVAALNGGNKSELKSTEVK